MLMFLVSEHNPQLPLQGTVIETLMMKRSSFSTRRQNILNAIFAIRSCTLAQAWPFTACRLVPFPRNFY